MTSKLTLKEKSFSLHSLVVKGQESAFDPLNEIEARFVRVESEQWSLQIHFSSR